MSGSDEFEAVLRFVEDEIGFAMSHYNHRYLDRRITARMRRLDVDEDDYGEYLVRLQADDDEGEQLLDALSINVTQFFRDTDVWDGVRSVLRELDERLGRTTVWSAPCSDGREPYSIGMLATADGQVDESRVDILGTDVDAAILELARAGQYWNTRTVDIEAELDYLDDPSLFVERTDDRFEVVPSVKRMVDFEQHDLINGSKKSGFDLVFCRNLFIYIDTAFKEPVLDTIAQSLTEGGFLVIGKTESLPAGFRDTFEPVDKRLRIYRLA